jgi:hypothetical protein
VSPEKVWWCLLGWRRTVTPAAVCRPAGGDIVTSGGFDRLPLPERARQLYDAGLTMAEIAAQLHCAPSTVHLHVHSA